MSRWKRHLTTRIKKTLKVTKSNLCKFVNLSTENKKLWETLFNLQIRTMSDNPIFTELSEENIKKTNHYIFQTNLEGKRSYAEALPCTTKLTINQLIMLKFELFKYAEFILCCRFEEHWCQQIIIINLFFY